MSNSGYGVHTTIYSELSDAQLYSMYRQSCWSKLGENERQNLLQETVNREALSKGEIGACKVRFSDLPNGVSGEQSGNEIRLNRDMFVNDRMVADTSYGTVTREYATSNVNALETVLHENEHAWQNQCISGEIQGNPQLTYEYRSNDFTTSKVVMSDGTERTGSHYMRGETAYDLYYFQSTERDAHRFSQARTIEIIDSVERQSGKDSTFSEYRSELNQRGYQAMLQASNQKYGTENFEQEVNRTLMNQYYGTKYDVNQKVENAVKAEMAASYDNMYITNQQHNNNGLSGYQPMTVDEYKSTIHDQVNAFYTHETNEPSVGQEEAVAETSQMAENQFNAIEEFEAQSQYEASSGEDTSASLSSEECGEDVDGGME